MYDRKAVSTLVQHKMGSGQLFHPRHSNPDHCDQPPHHRNAELPFRRGEPLRGGEIRLGVIFPRALSL